MTSEVERFWAKVDKRSDCWLWTASVSRGGYGQFNSWLDGRHRLWRAHRYAYEQIVGPIPDGLTLDHLCHTYDRACPGGTTCAHRRCVNPAHLEPVPSVVNKMRGLSIPALRGRQTECLNGHPLTAENTYQPPKRPAARYCRTCQRIRNRETYYRKIGGQGVA